MEVFGAGQCQNNVMNVKVLALDSAKKALLRSSQSLALRRPFFLLFGAGRSFILALGITFWRWNENLVPVVGAPTLTPASEDAGIARSARMLDRRHHC